MYDGLKDRARRVYDLLKHPGTAFVVVATPDQAALREAVFFAGRLADDAMPLGALVVNRIHRAAPIPQVPGAALERLAGGGADGRLLAELASAVQGVGVVEVPLLADDVHDLAGLRRLGEHLFAS